MPIKNYFHGNGDKVMKNMQKEYGAKADKVFYATANKRKMKPNMDEENPEPDAPEEPEDSTVKKSMKSVFKKGKKMPWASVKA